MKIFTSNDFHGYWPVPTAAVIVAKDEIEAKFYLRNELRSKNLYKEKEGDTFTVKEVNRNHPGVIMLSDGNY